MPTTIKLKNSVTTSNAPSSLVQGEVAINITDKKVWVGNAASTPVQLLGDGGSASFTSIAFGAGTVSNPSITFIGDTNTGIYSPTADTIAFTEGGVESMRIDSGGNVGIGLTNPSAYSKLAVLGAVTSGEATSTSGSTLLRGYYTNGALTNIGTMFASGGPVIGYGATGSSSVDGQLLSTTSVNVTRQALYMNGADFIYYTAPAQTTAIGSAVTSVSERMRLTSAGNLGIGTSSPQSLLDVKNGTTYSSSGTWLTRVQQNTNSTGSNGLSVMNAWAASTSKIFECAMGWNGSAAGYYPVFTVDGLGQCIWSTGTPQTEKMRFSNSGNLGIGTNNPSYLLDVAAEANLNGVRIGLNGDTINASNSLLAIRINNTERIRINSVGDVGIGTTSPQNKLQVRAADTGNVVGASAASINVTNSDSGAFDRTMDYQFSIGAGGSSEKIAAISGVYTNFSTSVGGAIAFATNNGSSAFAERMRITSAGQLRTTVTGTTIMDDYGNRAWVNFNGTGTPAIRASGNVTSITDNGVGDYTLNFVTSFPDANYSVSGSMGDALSTSANGAAAFRVKTYATGSVRVLNCVAAGVQADFEFENIIITR